VWRPSAEPSEPVKVPGKGDRWVRESMDAAVDHMTGKDRISDIADQL